MRVINNPVWISCFPVHQVSDNKCSQQEPCNKYQELYRHKLHPIVVDALEVEAPARRFSLTLHPSSSITGSSKTCPSIVYPQNGTKPIPIIVGSSSPGAEP